MSGYVRLAETVLRALAVVLLTLAVGGCSSADTRSGSPEPSSQITPIDPDKIDPDNVYESVIEEACANYAIDHGGEVADGC